MLDCTQADRALHRLNERVTEWKFTCHFV